MTFPTIPSPTFSKATDIRHWLRLVVAVGVLWSSTACLRFSLSCHLEAEGKTRIKLELSAVEAVLQHAIEEAASGIDSYPLLRKDLVLKRLEELQGVMLTYETQIERGVRHLKMDLELNNPADVNRLNLLGLLRLDHREGRWRWSFGEAPLGRALGVLQETSLLQQIQLLKPRLHGMSIFLEVRAPAIDQTNMTRQPSGAVTYAFQFDDTFLALSDKERLKTYEALLSTKEAWLSQLPGPSQASQPVTDSQGATSTEEQKGADQRSVSDRRW